MGIGLKIFIRQAIPHNERQCVLFYKMPPSTNGSVNIAILVSY